MLQIFRERQPIQGGQLFAGADRYLCRWPQCTRNHDTFRGQLSSELDGLVASLGQILESLRDSRCKRLSEVACLGRVGLLHLVEQQSPSLILRLDFSFLALRQLERLGRVAQPLAGHCAANLFESAMSPLNFALDPSRSDLTPAASVLGGDDLIIWRRSDQGPAGPRDLSRFMKLGFGRRKILGVAESSQLDESTFVRRVFGLGRRSSPCAFSTAIVAVSALRRAPSSAASIRFFLASIVLSSDANSAATVFLLGDASGEGGPCGDQRRIDSFRKGSQRHIPLQRRPHPRSLRVSGTFVGERAGRRRMVGDSCAQRRLPLTTVVAAFVTPPSDQRRAP